MIGQLLDKLGAWRTGRAPAKAYELDTLEHTLNVAGFFHGGRGLSTDAVRKLMHPSRRITVIDWRGCMATERRVDGTGIIMGQQHNATNGYNEVGALIYYTTGDCAGLSLWRPFAMFRFVGVWPYTIEEWH